MARVTSEVVDVRDMLCAQALAIVSRHLERTAVGVRVTVHYNGEDVKRDLLVWAAERGHRVRTLPAKILEIERH